MYSAPFYWIEGNDTARFLTTAQAETAQVAAVVRFFVDSAGTLRRYDYSPVSHSGDWVDDLTFVTDGAGRITLALRRAATTATTCGSIVRVEENFVAREGSLQPTRRALFDAAHHPLADTTCAESLTPLAALPASLDSLIKLKLLPTNWSRLREQAIPRAAHGTLPR